MTLQSDIAQLIIDNNQGLITPEKMRQAFQHVVDNLNPSVLVAAVEPGLSRRHLGYAPQWVPGTAYWANKLLRYGSELFLVLNDYTSATGPSGQDTTTGLPNAMMADINGFKLLRVSGGGGGGGGISGPITTGMIQGAGPLNMGNNLIANLLQPRTGLAGLADGTNRQYVDEAIAAGALYQGVYQIVANDPDLWNLTDSGFTPPVQQELNKPPTAGSAAAANENTVWFEISFGSMGVNAFPFTPVSPIPMEIRLSNGRVVKINLPVKSYITWVSLYNEIHDAFTSDADISHIGETFTSLPDIWISVNTPAPTYALWMSDQVASPFIPAAEGPNSTVRNTYNWVGQTKDENVPEPMQPGIPGIEAGTLIKNSDLLQWSDKKKGFDIISGASLTQGFSDKRYWQLREGNMQWRAQSYPKGAIVYGPTLNAWYVAVQDIAAVNAEPGTALAGARWRKINSTYGATVFFGKGDYDASDTTAANNWGLPADVYPSGQQPLNGDSYYDIMSGAVTDFSVVQSPPVYTVSGTLDPANANNSALGSLTMLANFPNGMPVMASSNSGLSHDSGPSGLSLTGTPWAGTAHDPIPPNTDIWFVWSGDSDADYSGWALLVDDGSAGWQDWSLTTPNPQSVPDVITAHTSYGFARNFDITLGNTADVWEVLLENITEDTQIMRIEMRDEAPNGPVYEFELLINATEHKIVPIAGVVQGTHISEIGIKRRAANNLILIVKTTAGIANPTYKVTVESRDGHLDSITPGPSTATAPTAATFNASKDYPDSAKLEAELIAASASADIQVPQLFTRSSIAKGGNQSAFTFGVPPKRYIKAHFVAQGGPQSNTWPQVIGQAGGWINWGGNNRSDVICETTKHGQSPTIEVANNMAVDNSGMYVSAAVKAANLVYVDVEITFYKEHASFLFDTLYTSSDNVLTHQRTRVIYGVNWGGKMTSIGYKNQGRAFDYIEAYITWE